MTVSRVSACSRYGWQRGQHCLRTKARAVMFPLFVYSACTIALGCQAPVPEPRAWVLLEPTRVWTLTGDLVPRAASAIDSASVVFVANDGQREFRVSAGEPSLLATLSPAEIEAVTVSAGHVWLASGNKLYSVALPDGSARLRFRLPESARFSTLRGGEGGIWAARTEDDRTTLLHLWEDRDSLRSNPVEVFTGTQVAVHRWSQDSVLVQELAFPFTLTLVSQEGVTGKTIRPSGAEFARVMVSGSPDNWVVGGAVRLEASLALVWLNNLQALERLALVIDVETGATRHARFLTEPMSIVEGLSGHNDLLLGGHELAAGRQLAIYRAELTPRGSMDQ